MSNGPFFSVVMPTRNRADLLPVAIQSVLGQDFEDFELIVSNNSSADNTEEVVGSFSDKRIRYVKTPTTLPIDDSFEFALSHALGKYTTFLPDDDAYTVSRLRKGFEVIDDTGTKLLVHKGAYYQQNENRDNGLTDTLKLGWFSNSAIAVEARRVIDNLYDKMPSMYYSRAVPLPSPFFYSTFPVLINAFYETAILNFLKTKVPKLIKTRSGDLYLGILFLNQIKDYVYLDSPLSITRMHPGSATVRAGASGANNLASTTEAEAPLENVPFKDWTERNVYMDIILEVLKDDPDGLGKEVGINWENYYRTCFEDLEELRSFGVDIDQRKQRLESLTKANQLSTGRPGNPGINNELRNKVRSWALTSPALRLRLLLSKKPDFLHARSLVMSSDYEEKNLLVYSKLLDEDLLAELSRFWLSRFRPIPQKWRLI